MEILAALMVYMNSLCLEENYICTANYQPTINTLNVDMCTDEKRPKIVTKFSLKEYHIIVTKGNMCYES